MKHFLLTMSALSCLALSTHIAAAQEDPYPAPSLTSPTSSDRPDAWKIKNALTAGPKFIADVQDLKANTPPEGKDWYYAGPHVMLVLPDSDKDALEDVGQDTSSGAPYVRGPSSPSPLLVIPVAKPEEEIIIRKAATSK